MLKLYDKRTLEGVEIFADDQKPYLFYPFAEQPTFRVDDKGSPIFKFIKYRSIKSEAGKQVGGICNFDTEFVVDPKKLKKIKKTLQTEVNKIYERRGQQPKKVQFATPPYIKGSAELLVSDENNVLVEKVSGAGVPSLVGRNIATFSISLSDIGAAVFEKALQGKGGFVQVVYKLWFSARVGDVRAHARFHASKYYEFLQTIDVEERWFREDDWNEKIEEDLRQREIKTVTVIPGAQSDPKIVDSIRASIHRSLDQAIARNLLGDVAVEKRDADQLYKKEDLENIRRDVTVKKQTNISINIREQQVIEHNLNPQGTLPNITTMKLKNGQKVKWKDHAMDVDADHPFFQELDVSIQVNADFENLPLHSVEVLCKYKQGTVKAEEEFLFNTADTVEHFVTFTHKNIRDYTYSYQVNYVGESKTLDVKPKKVSGDKLVINVDDLGIWKLDIAVGDINFDQVTQAQLTCRYEDSGVDPVERVFNITAESPEHELRELIFKPRNKPFQYKVKYFMENGKEFERDWEDHEADQLYVNDPFSEIKTIKMRAIGNLEDKIDKIFLDVTYTDAANGYSQAESFVLDDDTPFNDWAIPVIDAATGKVEYQGSISFQDGTTKDIPLTVAATDVISVGDAVRDHLEILILPDVLDWSTLRMVIVQIDYNDGDSDEKKTIVFRDGDSEVQLNEPLGDGATPTYKITQTHVLQDGTKHVVGPVESSDAMQILETPVMA